MLELTRGQGQGSQSEMHKSENEGFDRNNAKPLSQTENNGGFDRNNRDGNEKSGGYNNQRGDRPYEKGNNRNDRQNQRGDRENRGNYNDRRGDRDNQNRGENRQNQPRPQDPNSNFRLYYQYDPQFYQHVIRKEDPPYDFKIHLFLDKKEDDESDSRASNREITLKIFQKLEEFKALNTRETFMVGQNPSGNRGDKIRYTFQIEE